MNTGFESDAETAIVEKSEKEIIDRIKIEFLALSMRNTLGYHISFRKAFEMLDAHDVYDKYLTSDTFREIFIFRYFNYESALKKVENIDDFSGHYIITEENELLFSTEGFKIFSMIINVKKSYYIYKYFIQLESEYLRAIGHRS